MGDARKHAAESHSYVLALKKDYKSPTADVASQMFGLKIGGVNEGMVSVLRKNKSSLAPPWRKRAWL